MKAVITKEKGKAEMVDIKELSMRDDHIKVRTVAVAINPTDFHHVGGYGRIGGILGCDLSGTVEEIGKNCKSDVKKGDAVYGVCHGGNNNNAEDGAFAEFAMVKDGYVAKIPEGLSFEEAATLGVGTTTIGMSLYMTMKLPLPTESAEKPFPILIYGGSTATGTLAIQYAKLSGLTVITTASPKNFELVKSRGADAVFDYNDPECAKNIREFTNNSLHYVFDCISTASSNAIITDVFPTSSIEDMHLVALLPLDGWSRTDVKTTVLVGYTTWGEPFSKFGIDFPSFPEHYDFGVKFWRLTSQLLQEGKIKPHPVAKRPGGLAGVPAGISELLSGSVSGSKLVYTVAETSDEKIDTVSETIVRAPELPDW